MKNELLKNNKFLKTKLKEIKDKIEIEFRKFKRIKIDKNEDEDEDIKKANDFINKIDIYKNKINQINFNIYNSNTCLTLIKKEDILYNLKEELINLKKKNKKKKNQNYYKLINKNIEKKKKLKNNNISTIDEEIKRL